MVQSTIRPETRNHSLAPKKMLPCLRKLGTGLHSIFQELKESTKRYLYISLETERKLPGRYNHWITIKGFELRDEPLCLLFDAFEGRPQRTVKVIKTLSFYLRSERKYHSSQSLEVPISRNSKCGETTPKRGQHNQDFSRNQHNREQSKKSGGLQEKEKEPIENAPNKKRKKKKKKKRKPPICSAKSFN